jgi:two-component system, NarL family, sensor histidine kinase DesK
LAGRWRALRDALLAEGDGALTIEPDPHVRVPAARVAGIFAAFIALPAIIGLLGDEPTPARVAGVLAALVVFMGFFFHGVRGRLDPKPPAVVARAYVIDLVIAGTLTVADRPEWSLLFYYVVAIGALRLPRPWNIVVLPVTALTAGLTATAGGGNTSAAWGQALGLLGIGAAMVAMGEIMRTNRELLQARAEVARLAVADERTRFARDLHDLLGHSLSVIALKAQLARRRLPDDPETAAADVADIEAVTREALREVRQAVSGYRRPQLDAEVDGARTALDAAGIETTIDCPPVDLPAEVEAALAWTVREAATNVIRHSGATHSTIRLLPAIGQATVEVVDDGRGSNGEAGGGSGLLGLQERVREAGGRLEAGPREDGPGFRVRAIVPIGSLQ